MTRAERLAQKSYEAYKRHTKAAGYFYAPCWSWDELSPVEKQAWMEAASVVVDEVAAMVEEDRNS